MNKIQIQELQTLVTEAHFYDTTKKDLDIYVKSGLDDGYVT
jgi:Holliday junction resolvase RusA-like endonuclease